MIFYKALQRTSQTLLLCLLVLQSVAQMSGTYTIDANGSGPNNFTSFNDVATALESQGVSGPVTINVASGNYLEQVSFDFIFTTSEQSPIVLQADPQNTAPVVLEFGINCPFNYILRVRHVDWFTLRGIHIRNLQTSGNCGSVLSVADCKNAILENNIFESTFTNGLQQNAYVAQVYGEIQNVRFRSNTFSFGSGGIYIEHQWFPVQDQSVFLEDNLFLNNFYIGIDCNEIDSAIITGNTITADTTISPTAFGLRMQGCKTPTIARNYIGTNASSGYNLGIFLHNCVGSFLSPSRIANNCVYAGRTGSQQNGQSALRMTNSTLLNIDHNTFVRQGGSTFGFASAVYIADGSFNNFRNNIISAFDGVMMNFNGNAPVMEGDYNLFHGLSSNSLFFNGTPLADLAEWQDVMGLDSNSFEGNPGLDNTLTCTTCNEIVDAAGTATTGVIDDIEGRQRSTTAPDIGATEIVIPSAFTLGTANLVCSDSIMLQGNPEGPADWVVDGAIITSQNLELTTPGCESESFEVSLSFNSTCGAVSTSETIVLVPPADLPDTSVHLCFGQWTELDACGGQSAVYNWSTNETTQTIMVFDSGSYVVTKTELGCTSMDSVYITESAPVLLSDLTVCEEDLPVSANATIANGTVYEWSGGMSANEAINSFSQGGTYTVTVTDSYGCSSSSTMQLAAYTEPMAGIVYSQAGFLFSLDGLTASQQADSNSSFDWTIITNGGNYGPTSLSGPTPDVLFLPDTAIDSWLVILDLDNGCGFGSDSIVIENTISGSNELSGVSLRVFPNPAADHLNVELNTSTRIRDVLITNMIGQSFDTRVSQTAKGLRLQVDQLPVGTYQLILQTDDQVFTTTFVHQ